MTTTAFRPSADLAPAPIYLTMRDGILALAPGKVGLAPSSQTPRAWGVLLEMGFAEAVVTLVALADGTTSLYFSTGGGIIGGGTHTAVAQASQALVAAAEGFLDELAPAAAFPLPGVGRVRFTVLTFSGARTAEAAEKELAAGRQPLAPLYEAGQEVLTQVRQHTIPQPGRVRRKIRVSEDSDPAPARG